MRRPEPRPQRSRPVPGRFARRLTPLALALVALPLAGLAQAQLLAEVLTVTAISAQFDPSVSLPRGSLRATGAGVDVLLQRVEDAGSWTDWEAYTLGGIAVGLAGAVDQQVTTAFAVAGYFEQERSQRTVQGPAGPETHTRIVYVGDDGGRRLLYFVRAGQEVVWLTARSR
ncbi:MAG: hypothetical protein GX560_03155 [Deinococcales bacterium]|nr:hypothetical protein [Deinococcales bacterium]